MIPDRFWEKVDKSGECWLWMSCTRNGYGAIGINYKTHYAHRVVYREMFGDIPEGMDICHKCDVRSCVNPAHLFAGTRKDNMMDASEKGRLGGLRANFGGKKKIYTHCRNGHEFSKENRYWYGSTSSCKVCSNLRYLKSKRDKKEIYK